MIITEAHLASYYKHGYVVIPDFLTGSELAAAQTEMRFYFPPFEEYEKYSTRSDTLNMPPGILNPAIEFPFRGDFLNTIHIHPELIRFVESVLGTSKIGLQQSMLFGKYTGGQEDQDQLLHVDYRRHTLTYPSSNPTYWQVTAFIYYTDVTEELSPTYIVSWEATQRESFVPWNRIRSEHPTLYASEHPILVSAGSLLLYNTRTFHRGSAFRKKGERILHSLAYGRNDCRWMGFNALAGRSDREEMERFFKQATPHQREMLGFPPPDHDFWTEETIVGVSARFPGIDMTPYRIAAKLGTFQSEDAKRVFFSDEQ